jgi:hypothetical protein
MALYAFDGTWNLPDYDQDENDLNTNVIKFAEHYAAITAGAGEDLAVMKASYRDGVGTRFGRTGKIVGGLTGMGARDRIREMIELLRQNFEAGDTEVHVIGFSRGAAIALQFCNDLDDGVNVGGEKIKPMVTFLGLWDIVPAFGIPGVFTDWAADINLGWDLDLPENVLRCSHAMALNETRQAFEVHRLDPKGRYPHVRELWFRGVHSDVGGGNGNVGLQSIALHWMMEQAREPRGDGEPVIPFTDAQMAAVKALWQPKAPIYTNTSPGDRENRPLHPKDEEKLHPTAARRLKPGESIEFEVDAKLVFHYADIVVEAGAAYTFIPDPAGLWKDDTIDCDAAGWPDQLTRSASLFARIKENLLESRLFGLLRRVRKANWFELCACPGFDDDAAFPVGRGQHAATPWTCPRTAPLTFFPNDALHPNKYDNNSGSLKVRVTRAS